MDDVVKEQRLTRERVFEIDKEAARYYRDMLFSEEGKEGMKYLLSRGLTKKTIRRYGLGFVTRNWRGLYNHFKDKGYTDSEMEQASLISTDEKTCDIFKCRVMFPIVDRMKNVVAFGGRALESDAKAKYLNSRETIAFHKSNNLFSINFAQNTDKEYFILCEGYMDVIALNQAGFDNAVATLGTAITPQQAFVISRYTSNVVIAYDSDEAGQRATERAIDLLVDEGVNVMVLEMKGAKDPDEYIKKYGKEAFKLLVSESLSTTEFKLRKIQSGLLSSSSDGLDETLKRCVEFLADIPTKEGKDVFMNEIPEINEERKA